MGFLWIDPCIRVIFIPVEGEGREGRFEVFLLMLDIYSGQTQRVNNGSH